MTSCALTLTCSLYFSASKEKSHEGKVRKDASSKTPKTARDKAQASANKPEESGSKKKHDSKKESVPKKNEKGQLVFKGRRVYGILKK